MKISAHFDREEFRCKCPCHGIRIDRQLVTLNEEIRMHYRKPVHIISAFRCKEHNEDVGGAPNSQHLLGKATDIMVTGVTPDDVADYVEEKYPNRYGIGRYDTFTHIDVRDTRARWDERTKDVA